MDEDQEETREDTSKEEFLSITTYKAIMSPFRAVVTMRLVSLMFVGVDCLWPKGHL